jgi:glucose-6-phosphate isomerase
MMSFISAFDDGSLRLDGSLVASHVDIGELEKLQDSVNDAVGKLQNGTGEGSDFLGWLDPPSMISDEELVRIRTTAKRLRDETDCMVVIGIGGSYLGTRACEEALRQPGNENHRLYYAGTNISPRYHSDLLSSLDGKKFAINMVSKSGTTTEPAIAFRLIRKKLEDSIGQKEAGRLIVATTDRQKGALRNLADSQGWESFVVPDNVGGRYSVLTPVGLFPLAYAGIDIDALLGGATECAIACRGTNLERNPARMYASIRRLLYKSGLSIEILASFEPRLGQLVEWWKQLYGESEGKDGKGLFPGGVVFSRDLHSLGQWIQEGPRILFETFLSVETGEPSLAVPPAAEEKSEDGLDYLTGEELADINRQAREATRKAHAEGGCPNVGLYVPKLDAYHLGVLIYFFEYACAISGYMNGVNPFNQPGVEVYKRKMFELLGKPGYGKDK